MSELNFTVKEQSLIQPQTLKSRYVNGAIATSSDQKLFALGRDTTENFMYDSYLNTKNFRICYKADTSTPISWWLRTGYSGSGYSNYAHGVLEDGYAEDAGLIVYDEHGLRPAFVLRLI